MKTFLLCLLLTSSLLPLHAQQTPVPSQPQGYTHADTARVVHTIFRSHRIGSALWTATGVFVGVQFLRTLASISRNQPGAEVGGIGTLGVTLVGVIPIGIGIGKLARFGSVRETEVLRAFDLGKPLPPDVLSRLRPRYFEE
jgi:hypothetical protein